MVHLRGGFGFRIAAFVLAIFTMRLCEASHWDIKTKSVGSDIVTIDGTPTTHDWPLAPAKTLIEPGNSGGVVSHGTYTITLTWTDDRGHDPVPPYLSLLQTASASGSATGAAGGSASASDGLGDAQTGTSGTAASGCQNSHAVKMTPDKGIVTISTTVDASASISDPHAEATLVCGSSYSVAVHAQPYHMMQTEGYAYTSGVLHFKYNWLSTSGNLHDISPDVWVYEIVNYPGGSDPYYPGPPVSTSYPNPSTNEPKGRYDVNGAVAGKIGFCYDEHAVPSFYKPYSALTFTASQKYCFDDFTSGDMKVVLIDGLSITRDIYEIPYTYWWYSCIKSNITSYLHLGN